jgi:phosphoribosylamine--glycine ligase
MKNILILGSGGREHAIAKKFSESSHVDKIFVIPGNDGINSVGSGFIRSAVGSGFIRSANADTFQEIHEFIKENEIDLVFIGNEQYLADGIVDYLASVESIVPIDTRKNQSVSSNPPHSTLIGPTQSAARIESSKVFSKNLMKKYNIPTAFYESFDDIERALEYIQDKAFPIVLKADGLAAGKGVLIARDRGEAEVFIKEMLSGEKFGDAGREIVIEEFLEGEEASVFAFCDGENFVSTIFSQDHKRAFDNDEGLNTGGMGAFAPVDKFAHLKDEVDRLVFEPILRAMKEEGCAFVGVLFAGLMICPHSTLHSPHSKLIKIIEFNSRLGDPETQVILPLLENDLYELCEAIANKKIHEVKLKWKKKYAVNVVLASKGYPETFEKGHEIDIHPDLFTDPKLHLYFAGVKKNNDILTNNGGRVLSLTCLNDTLQSAINYIYTKLPLIKSDILRYRNDIGAKGIRSK